MKDTNDRKFKIVHHPDCEAQFTTGITKCTSRDCYSMLSDSDTNEEGIEKLPSKRIEQLARKRMDKEREKGAILFRKGSHQEAIMEAIIDYLDETYEK